jgi:hypothetical protein
LAFYFHILKELLIKIGEEESDCGVIQGVAAFVLKELKITTKINSTIIIAYLQADNKTKNLKKEFSLTSNRLILNLICNFHVYVTRFVL